MPRNLSLLGLGYHTIDRLPYLVTGIVLFAIKFAIDWSIAWFGFGQEWSPMNYLIWPNHRVLRVLELNDPERWFSLTMLLVSLPFIWIGVVLTMHRMRAAGLPLRLVALFFVPLVNFLLFAVLIVLPTREEMQVKVEVVGLTSWQQAHRNLVGNSNFRSGLAALLVTVPSAALAVAIGAQVLQSYGFGLFVGAPFMVGMVSVLLFGFSQPKRLSACLLVAAVSLSFASVALLLCALEGAICLLMASPIALVLALFGGFIGYVIQSRPWLNGQAVTATLALLVTLPALMAAESAGQPEPVLQSVETEVIVSAPPEKVWPLVIAFPPLAEPNDWLFNAGVAYPQHAEIHGSGVGAVRHCVFSTGTFVEPIEVWNPPTLLRFGVTDQPDPMREWSPYRIHPPHLHDYLRSQRGEFRLEPLAGGRTRLVGTTWYTNRMWPASYWTLWSDHIIHRIHTRVLEHIQQLAERG